jgi:hypothetical protein
MFKKQNIFADKEVLRPAHPTKQGVSSLQKFQEIEGEDYFRPFS